MFSQDPCFGVKEKITHIVETTKIVPQIDSTWALPIKIVNAKKLLQVFAIFLNAFSILIGSSYSWFRCRYIGRSKAAYQRLRRHYYPLYVVSPVKIKKQERSFGNLPTLIFLDNEHVHPVRSMDSPKFFLSNVGHNTLFLKVAK